MVAVSWLSSHPRLLGRKSRSEKEGGWEQGDTHDKLENILIEDIVTASDDVEYTSVLSSCFVFLASCEMV